MSWHYLQEQAGASLEDICSDGVPLPPLRSKITHAAFCSNGKLTASYLDSLSGTTCKHSTGNRGEERSMSSAEDFPARTSVAPGKVRASLEHEVAYGVKWHASFAKWDQDTSSWKTHQCSLFGGWESFLEGWPRWGMMRDGVCSERVMQEHPTSGTESGSWPTPLCMDTLPPKSPEALQKEATQARPGRSQPANLRDCVHPKQMDAWKEYQQMWPTPSASEDAAGTPDGKMQWMLTHAAKSGCSTRKEYKDGGTKTPQKFPTPRAQDSYERRNYKTMKRIAEQGGDMTLKTKINTDNGKPGQLNPPWVEWLMGWPLHWTSLEPLAMDWRDWQTDPADSGEVPRVATGVKHRTERLKAIGNGQVPAVAALAWQILSGNN